MGYALRSGEFEVMAKPCLMFWYVPMQGSATRYVE